MKSFNHQKRAHLLFLPLLHLAPVVLLLRLTLATGGGGGGVVSSCVTRVCLRGAGTSANYRDFEHLKKKLHKLEGEVKADIFQLIHLLEVIQDKSGLNAVGCVVAFLSRGNTTGDRTLIGVAGTSNMQPWVDDLIKGKGSSAGLQMLAPFESHRALVGVEAPPSLVVDYMSAADALRTAEYLIKWFCPTHMSSRALIGVPAFHPLHFVVVVVSSCCERLIRIVNRGNLVHHSRSACFLFWR